MESAPLAINTPARDCGDIKRRPWFSSLLQGLALGLIVLGIVSTVLWLQQKPGPVATGPIELKRGVEFLPNSTMKAYGLHLPRAGRLVISLSSDSGSTFSVYLVGLPGTQRSARGNELHLVGAFTAEAVKDYSRTTPVEPGEYHLTIVNSAPTNDSRRLNLSMLVRLEN